MNSRLALKQEIEGALTSPDIDLSRLSRPGFNEVIKTKLVALGWEDQPAVFPDAGDPSARMDFRKNRIGVEVEFGHASFLGIDLIKFQVSSYSGLDHIDVGLYVVTTRNFQRVMKNEYEQNWEGSLTYEKVVRYLPHFRSAIQVPIYVIGIDF